MIFIVIYILFLLTGLITGLLSSLMGIGGGLVVVPGMYLYLAYILHLKEAIVMHLAIGTSLAVMIITTSGSIISHAKRGDILWPVVWKMFPYIAVGSFIGSIVSVYLHSEFLRYLFILFLVYVIAKAIFKKQFTKTYKVEDFKLPAYWFLSSFSVVLGVLCVLLGVGGSPISIPLLRKYKMPMRQAASIAVAIAPAVCIVGIIGYIYTGWNYPNLPAHSFSFIYLPAFFGISIGTLIGVPIGTKISHALSDKNLAVVIC